MAISKISRSRPVRQIIAVYYEKHMLHIQDGAEETHVFHVRITLFIFNIKSFNYAKKEGILMHFKSTCQIMYGK